MQLIAWTKRLGMDSRFQERYLNEGFSGGEKKRNEMLQMALLEPVMAVLDETDSGLDIDALAPGRQRHRRDPQRSHRARHPAHHALPAHPRLPAPRRRARADRRPDRRDRRRRARQDRRGPRLRRLPDDAVRSRVMSALDVAAIRRDFPLLEREVNGKRVTYLDSASSAQKPLAVLDAMDHCYRHYYANIHRGVYTIAEEATAAYELGPPQGRRLRRRRRRSPRSCSRATRPRRSTSSRTRGPAPTCAPATRSCSRTWSTTPTSCRGTCSPPSAASSSAGSR